MLIVLGWYGGIFWFSSQPDLRISSNDLTDLIFRKLAHLAAFAGLTLACLVLSGNWVRARAPSRFTARHVVVAWWLTLLLASSDEWHQTFVHGRVGHPQDVGIDMVGATIALLVARRVLARGATPDAHPEQPA
jgi:VanZ family protein